MTSQRHTDVAGHRGLLVALAGGALVLGALACLSLTEPLPRPPVPKVVSPVDRWEAMASLQPPEAAADESETKSPVRAAAPEPSPVQEPQATPAPRLRFLGKIKSGNETTVVLFVSGRTLKVHDPGPIDESDYVVDDLEDHSLVVHDTRLGTSQNIEFTSPLQTAANWSPEESPQD